MNALRADGLWRLEPWIVWALGALAFMAVPLVLGEIGLGWDALNHHVYLGWVAESPRFDRDLLAAGYQAYQAPYLYWPMYKLATAGVSGPAAGVVLALLQSLAIPPVWWVARLCCPGAGAADLALRVLSVALAFLGGVTLSLLDSTSNDLLASIPFLWAVAFGLVAIDPASPWRVRPMTAVALSGLMAGIAVGLKLSNGPLALVLPVLWALPGGGLRAVMRRLALAALAGLVGVVLTYGAWGWQLWLHFGNPIYPFHDAWFEAVRAALGWAPP